eukprot:6271145-Amphidinium_carterae.1
MALGGVFVCTTDDHHPSLAHSLALASRTSSPGAAVSSRLSMCSWLRPAVFEDANADQHVPSLTTRWHLLRSLRIPPKLLVLSDAFSSWWQGNSRSRINLARMQVSEYMVGWPIPATHPPSVHVQGQLLSTSKSCTNSKVGSTMSSW